MSSEPPDPHPSGSADPAVAAVFAAAGITPSDVELAAFTMLHPILRGKADRIYELDLGDQP